MRKAIRWWGLTLLIAVVPGLAMQRWLRPRSEQLGLRLVRAEIPEAWSALPITARLSEETTTTSDNGCGEGYGSFLHEGRLGRFRVRWSELMVQGLNAGPTGWSAEAPELLSACPPLPELHPYPPDTLHEDTASGLYVLERSGRALAACRVDNVVISPAHEVSPGDRAAATGAMVALVLAASGMLRRRVGRG